jgi:asparagine synthase (glutamine-hydrolysing)
MCGIAGIFDLAGTRPIDESLLRTMNDRLVHRGPDDEGYLVDGPIGLAMRRLSIIDLGTGHQPVHNEDKTISIVFNGEIYNYRDLTAALRAKGHVFYTASDTETIVHLFEEYGSGCVEHLRGMFAFALWDRSNRSLLLARDRLGIKPLYYTTHGARLLFGSELKALLADPALPRDIDPEGLAAYLRYGYVPEPLTILKHVHRLPPGHLLIAKAGRIELKPYWDVVPFFAATSRPRSEADCREELTALLHEAVQLRLVSDVPVGAFLSGGVDSSMVVALMARYLDHPVKTFSIGFEDEAFNELPYARKVAQHLGTDHHELVLRPESTDILGQLVGHFDEPFGDPSALPTYFVSKLARESVKVVLSGDGGDEVFGGYDRYFQHLRRGYADRIPTLLKRGVLRPLSAVLPTATPGKRLLYNLSLPPVGRYLDAISYCAPRYLRRILSADFLARLSRDEDADYRVRIDTLTPAHMLSRMQALDFKTYLPGDILTKVDRMSMAHSIEARVPLLDHKLVEKAASLPPSLKINGSATKYVFKQIAASLLPPGVVERPKQGFAVPLQRWFKEELNGFLREILSDPATRQREYFDSVGLRKFLGDKGDRATPNQLWMLGVLELWHRNIVRTMTA